MDLPEIPRPVRRDRTARPPGALVRAWRHWPVWSGYAALVWCLGYGALAVAWSSGAAGFPYGDADPDGAGMGSVLAGAAAADAAPLLAGGCLAGALVAVALLRTSGRIANRLAVGAAWLLAGILLLVLPDARLLQNAAYALLFIFVKLDWRVLNQGVVVLGGLAFAGAALAAGRRRAGRCPSCGSADRPSRLVRLGPVAAWTAFLAPLPYGLVRLAWALGVPLGIDQGLADQPLAARFGEAALAALAIGGGVLALGLVRPWGEVWPRWIPVLAGRRIPPALPTTLGGLAAILVTIGGLSVVRIVVGTELGWLRPEPEGPEITGWGAGGPGWLWPLWGLGLAVATAAYHRRRRPRCPVCLTAAPSAGGPGCSAGGRPAGIDRPRLGS
ncbi:hypothetical protein [Micromonospora siamensis]|uniref:Uncharacterized protein n=1 Tax=Micromonospora siamensis TaxID=299152 RepID=A0A1C5HGY0_9ACTN|nr:hypothetical protein [Micromonospora siamensis]SCG45245.1 hypothetical protein GA0074704_1709 [Micromonospora siamensis]